MSPENIGSSSGAQPRAVNADSHGGGSFGLDGVPWLEAVRSAFARPTVVLVVGLLLARRLRPFGPLLGLLVNLWAA